MQETAIADGVGERLSLEGDPVFEAPQTPYKKMPSWGGMRQAGCGEAKTVKAHWETFTKNPFPLLLHALKMWGYVGAD